MNLSDRDVRLLAKMLEQELVYSLFVCDDNAAKIKAVSKVLMGYDYREWQDILEPYSYHGEEPLTAKEKTENVLNNVRSWLASK